MLSLQFREKNEVFIVSVVIINIAFQIKRFLNVSVFGCPAYISGYIAVTSNRCYGSEHWEFKVPLCGEGRENKTNLKICDDCVFRNRLDLIQVGDCRHSCSESAIHCPDQCFVGEMLNNAIINSAGCYPSNGPVWRILPLNFYVWHV